MAIDDNPIEVLRKQFELEDISKAPISDVVIKVSASLAKFFPLPSPLQLIVQAISDRIKTEGVERIAIMLKTVSDEVCKHDREITQLRNSMAAEQRKFRVDQEARLVVDGARRASTTRSITRVQRVGIILARSIASPLPPVEDDIEEMMRVATELSEVDVTYLRNLVNIQGKFLDGQPHVQRYTAYQSWASGPWGESVDPTIDSVFHKLESYGLVSAIAPNNTFNIMADIQTRFALLPKGKNFAQLIESW